MLRNITTSRTPFFRFAGFSQPRVVVSITFVLDLDGSYIRSRRRMTALGRIPTYPKGSRTTIPSPSGKLPVPPGKSATMGTAAKHGGEV